jgi:hypothetical protein
MSPTQRTRRPRRIPPHVLRLVVACALICASLISSAALRPAAAAWLDDKHEEMCRSHRGVHIYWQLMRITRNPATCTANCYGYQLICRDGTKTALTSQYPPGVSELTIFFREYGGLGFLVKLLMFAPVAFFAFVSTYGSKDSFDRMALQNGIIAGLFGVTLLVWGAGDMGEGEWSLARPLDYIVGSVMTFAVVPLFLIVSIPAFLRGWNFLFVAHPAAPLVRPAMRGQSVNVEGLAGVLAEGAHDSGDAATYHYQHQAEKARALAAQLNTDSAIAEARAERERRRAELAEAERFLEEMRRRSEGGR